MQTRTIFYGHLGRKPELRTTPTGRKVVTLNVATSEYRGENNKEMTIWRQVDVWGAAAEACARHLDKGHAVIVEAQDKYPEPRVWKDRQGNYRASHEYTALPGGVTFAGRPLGASAPAELTEGEAEVTEHEEMVASIDMETAFS